MRAHRRDESFSTQVVSILFEEAKFVFPFDNVGGSALLLEIHEETEICLSLHVGIQLGEKNRTNLAWMRSECLRHLCRDNNG